MMLFANRVWNNIFLVSFNSLHIHGLKVYGVNSFTMFSLARIATRTSGGKGLNSAAALPIFSERWGWVRAASSPGSLSYPSRSVGTGTREPWERGWSAGSFFPKSVCELVSHPDVLGGSSCVLVPRTGSGGGDEPNERPSRRLLGIETIQWIIARLIGQSKRVLIEIFNKKWYKADDVL